MDNTEKLVRALIDYMGADIEEVRTAGNRLGIINEKNPPRIDYKLTKKKVTVEQPE